MSRTETGPMRIGDDWTGVFIRGDDAMKYAMTLGQLLRCVKPADFTTSLQWEHVRSLRDLLRSCDESTHTKRITP